MDYKPTDYTNWDFSGQGKNIFHLLSEKEKEIWQESLPSQDKRNDQGHVEVATYLALKLLGYFKASRDVVIPATILHDTGWSQMAQEELDLFNAMVDRRKIDPRMEKEYDPILRKRHHERGEKFSRNLLERLDYSAIYIPHICEIISQHDTRKGFYSPEDEIVRSADRLWRVFLTSIFMGARKWGRTIENFREAEEPSINKEGFYPNNQMREIAYIEMEHSIKEAKKREEDLKKALQEYRKKE